MSVSEGEDNNVFLHIYSIVNWIPTLKTEILESPGQTTHQTTRNEVPHEQKREKLGYYHCSICVQFFFNTFSPDQHSLVYINILR